MTLPTKTLAAALMAAAIPLYAGSAGAAPLSQPLTLGSADIGTVEQVQYRWNRGRWIGPAAAGLAAGAIIGGAVASRYYNDGYYAYGAAPGYVAAPRYRIWRDENYGNGSAATSPFSAPGCPSDREDADGYPSWMCR